jgi:hypothetical protein
LAGFVPCLGNCGFIFGSVFGSEVAKISKRLGWKLLIFPLTIRGRERKIGETIEFPKWFTVLGNFAVVLWIILGSVGFWLFNQVAGWVFLLTALIGVYGVLKFLGCLRPCHQCKKCTFGLGRISALYFGKRSLKDPKESYGMASAVFFYALLGPFPAAFLLVSTVQAFEVLKIAVLLCLLTISLYSALTWHTTRKL